MVLHETALTHHACRWQSVAHLLLSKQTRDVEMLVDACWTLSYLSEGSNDQIQAVIECGVVPPLVACLAHASTTVVTPALRTVRQPG